jgi:predicted PurR-regulated permease PerM
MSRIIDRILLLVFIVIMMGLAAHIIPLVVAGVLAAGLDPVASALQHVLSMQRTSG